MHDAQPSRSEEGVVARKRPGHTGCGLVHGVDRHAGDGEEGGHEDCAGDGGVGCLRPDGVDGEASHVSLSVGVGVGVCMG